MTEGPIFDMVCRAISDDSRHRILRGHKFRCFDSQIDPSGQCFATASEDGTVKIWHLATGQPMAVLEHSASEILRVCWSPFLHDSPEQYFAFGCADGTVHVYSYQTGSPCLLKPKGVLDHGDGSNDGQIYHCEFVVGDACWQQEEEDGKEHMPALQLVTACDNLINMWDVKLLEKITCWEYPTIGENMIGGPRNPENISYVFGMALSRDKVAAALSDGTVRVNELKSKAPLAVLRLAREESQSHLTSVAWAPGGRRLAACAGNGAVHLWQEEEGGAAAAGPTAAAGHGHGHAHHTHGVRTEREEGGCPDSDRQHHVNHDCQSKNKCAEEDFIEHTIILDLLLDDNHQEENRRTATIKKSEEEQQTLQSSAATDEEHNQCSNHHHGDSQSKKSVVCSHNSYEERGSTKTEETKKKEDGNNNTETCCFPPAKKKNRNSK